MGCIEESNWRLPLYICVFFPEIECISSSSFLIRQLNWIDCMASNYRWSFKCSTWRKGCISLLFKGCHVRDLSHTKTTAIFIIPTCFLLLIFNQQKPNRRNPFFNQQIHPYCLTTSFPTFASNTQTHAHAHARAHAKKETTTKMLSKWLAEHERVKNKNKICLAHSLWLVDVFLSFFRYLTLRPYLLMSVLASHGFSVLIEFRTYALLPYARTHTLCGE